MESGKLLFELRGYKLRGVWTLFRTGGRRQTDDGSQWLLMKKPDAGVAPAGGRRRRGRVAARVRAVGPDRRGELRDGCDRIEEVRTGIEASDAPRRLVDPRSLPLMLATRR